MLGTDCIDSQKSNYLPITTTTAPYNRMTEAQYIPHADIFHFISKDCRCHCCSNFLPNKFVNGFDKQHHSFIYNHTLVCVLDDIDICVVYKTNESGTHYTIQVAVSVIYMIYIHTQTDRYDIAEMLLKVALNNIALSKTSTKNRNTHFCTLGLLAWKRIWPQFSKSIPI